MRKAFQNYLRKVQQKRLSSLIKTIADILCQSYGYSKYEPEDVFQIIYIINTALQYGSTILQTYNTE